MTVKVTLALRRTKLAECADAMNINWLKSHSAPPHRLAERGLVPAIYCATSSLPPFVRNAVLATHRKPEAGTPRGDVRLVSDGCWTARARGYNPGIETCMGKTVVFEIGAVRLLIAEGPAMTVAPELFRSHGVEPLYCKIVVVKSPNGFRAAYERRAPSRPPARR